MEEYKINTKNILNKRMLMIEQDAGYINPNDERNKPFITEVNKIGTGNIVIAEPLKLFVILQKHSVENRNGRIYPEDILKREANNYQKLINDKRALGEAEHPESSIINTSRVAHNITKIWWEGKTLMGEIEIIMSPGFIKYGVISCEGDNIANLLRLGYMIGVSSRGVGSLKEVNGKNIVQDDFEIICWDIVTSPSTPGSWMFNNHQEAKVYTESMGNKSILNEKLDNFLKD
jgi:hypothetical protein